MIKNALSERCAKFEMVNGLWDLNLVVSEASILTEYTFYYILNKIAHLLKRNHVISFKVILELFRLSLTNYVNQVNENTDYPC